jgi:hypothetical protein
VSGKTWPTIAEAVGAARRLIGIADWSLDEAGMKALVRSDLGLSRRVGDALAFRPFAPRESVVESILPDGWELEGDDLDGLLVCPHGSKIEMDGRCPLGCVSPLRTAGLI